MNSQTKLIEEERSYKILEAAFEVHNTLSPGFLEVIYENALAFELRSRGFQVESQVPIKVVYKEIFIGEHVLDMVVDGKIIVELKASLAIALVHKKQVLSYVRAAGMPLALLINFGGSRVEHIRIANTLPFSTIRKPL